MTVPLLACHLSQYSNRLVTATPTSPMPNSLACSHGFLSWFLILNEFSAVVQLLISTCLNKITFSIVTVIHLLLRAIFIQNRREIKNDFLHLFRFICKVFIFFITFTLSLIMICHLSFLSSRELIRHALFFTIHPYFCLVKCS